MRHLFAAAAALAAVAASSASVARADDSVVVTPLGAVQGVVGDSWRVFAGVPYAQPPVGPLRWADPKPVQPWSGTLNATQDPPGCWQLCTNDEPPHICPQQLSEDCLYMNIWTPRMTTPPANPLPVLLFIHGERERECVVAAAGRERSIYIWRRMKGL